MDSAPRRSIPLVRIISRLAVGGSTIQAISLPRLLEPRYQTTLVTGVEGPREGEMHHLARALGVQPVVVPSLHRELGAGDSWVFTLSHNPSRRSRIT